MFPSINVVLSGVLRQDFFFVSSVIPSLHNVLSYFIPALFKMAKKC